MRMFTSHTRRPKNQSVRAAAEIRNLEPRVLPAGNVTVSNTNGSTVSLLGDGANNSIRVFSDANKVYVQGIGTTVNGLIGPVRIDDLFPQTGNQTLLVDLGSGNDTLEYSVSSEDQWFLGPNNLYVAGNAGNDTTTIRAFGFNIFDYGAGGTDTGNDTLLFEGIRGNNEMQIDMGAGNDKLTFRNVGMMFGPTIRGGAGNDETHFINYTSLTGINYGGGGTDSGNDLLTLTSCSMADMQLDLGQGNDRVLIDGSSFFGAVSRVKLGDGLDSFRSTKWIGEQVILDAGAGADNLQVDLQATRLDLYAGDGNDSISIDHLKTVESSTLQAGSGNDTIFLRKGELGGTLEITGAEGRDTLFVAPDFGSLLKLRVNGVETRL